MIIGTPRIGYAAAGLEDQHIETYVPHIIEHIEGLAHVTYDNMCTVAGYFGGILCVSSARVMCLVQQAIDERGGLKRSGINKKGLLRRAHVKPVQTVEEEKKIVGDIYVQTPFRPAYVPAEVAKDKGGNEKY